MRQARTNPARKTAAHPKLGGGSGSNINGSGSRLTNGINPHAGHPTPSTQPPAKFYPALTAFTDAVDALPSETIRHFTLLREVDAKAYGPEAVLRSLITAAQELPAPDDPYEFDPALEAMKQLDELQRRRDELTTPAEAMLLHELEATQAAEIAAGAKTILGHAETRRSRCLQMRTQISEILVTLDEKIHVITTAYEALQKHLQRIDHAYSYVQHEIPDLYRLGSTEHWAYKEPVKKGTAAAQARAAERAQREAEERHAAQQQRELETSNTRSETRREALLRQKAAAAAAQQQQAAAAAAAAAAASAHEEDEQAPRDQNHHAQPTKKLHGNSKIRKEQEALASAKRMAEHQTANGGGGLIPAAAAAAAAAAVAATATTTPLVAPQQKRRKTTNTTKETPMAAEKVSAPGTATKGAVSPRAGTPASTTSKRGGKSGSGAGAGRGGRR